MAQTQTDVTNARTAYASKYAGSSLYGLDQSDDSTAKPASVVFADTPYAVPAGTGVVLVDATGGNIVVTLPAATGQSGRVLTVKKTDVSANTVTIDANASETIDGATTSVISAQWASKMIVSNGTSWFVI